VVKKLIFITICDIKPGRDESVYSKMLHYFLRSSGVVTPLVMGRLFERADVIFLLHSDDMESLNDYLIKNVRSIKDVQELVVVPIYEFKLLSSFDFMVETDEQSVEAAPPESEELLFFMAKIDVAPARDRTVYNDILSLEPTDEAVPLMTGHTFHSKEFDMVIFFLAKSLESAWEFVKRLRIIDGVWDTEMSLIAHFEGLVALERFKELVAVPSARSSHRRRRGE